MDRTTPLKRPRTADPSPTNYNYYGNSISNDEAIRRHIQEILTELQQAISSKQRVRALRNLLHFLRYDPSTRLCRCPASTLECFVHGKCIQLLCLQLGYAIGRHRFDHGNRCGPWGQNHEILLISTVLDIFYRYCPELVTEHSIQKNGSEVLRLSQEVFINYQREGVGQDQTQEKSGMRGSGDFLSIVSIWHSCSSCSLGTMLLLQHPGTLKAINYILSSKMHQSHHDTSRIETIMECLGLLKNLTYFGEDHRQEIVDQTNLLTTLTRLTDIPNKKTRERLSAVFRNLALSADLRSRLTKQTNVLAAIVRMANFGLIECNNLNGHDSHHENANCKKNTLRNILSTVANLAIDRSTNHLMVFYGDGILIEELKQFLVQGEDFVLRKRASRALRLLAKNPSSAPLLIMQNNQLLEILSDLALNDENDSVRVEATEAFAACAELIRAPMTQHNNILDALTHMLITSTRRISPSRVNLDIVARTLQEQASHQINKRAMIRRKNLLAALANVILSEHATLSAKESVSATFVNLSEEEDNQEIISIPIILIALVHILLDRPSVLDANNAVANVRASVDRIITSRIRESSVRTILNLAKTPSNRQAMAKQTALIQSLLRFAAASTTNDDLKKQVKTVILQLAAEL
ncbi:unnamed protein product [Pseudo-nitzschia multistriata]|uniref:Armadillo repeat-containing domain-containing protein n=1 Tax=Pseudo-nitzschia multistriata TaxID=183589 RepID=A0A448ZKQ3_9STRA|nr:unnamed protein product [Pseudo-nitzschia multistriata]